MNHKNYINISCDKCRLPFCERHKQKKRNTLSRKAKSHLMQRNIENALAPKNNSPLDPPRVTVTKQKFRRFETCNLQKTSAYMCRKRLCFPFSPVGRFSNQPLCSAVNSRSTRPNRRLVTNDMKSKTNKARVNLIAYPLFHRVTIERRSHAKQKRNKDVVYIKQRFLFYLKSRWTISSLL